MTSTQKVGYHELTETINEYKWTLHNFASFNQPSGKGINSEIFLSHGLKWYITLYPNGDEEDNKEYVSVYLQCVNNTKITVDCEFIMSNTIKVYKSCKVKCSYEYNNEIGLGLPRFVYRDILLDDLEEKDDILTLVIKITFSNGSQDRSYLNLQQDFGLLLKTRENTDIILISKDENKHKVHKAILACRSQVFSAMFQHNMKENQDNVVKIKDVDDDTLKAMLYFMYTGELVDKITGVDNFKKLLIAADKYELNDLKRICINYLHAKMDFDNVLDLIQFGDTYNMNELKLKGKEYFLQNHKEILSIERRENLKDLTPDIVEDLLLELSSKLSL